MGHLAKQRDASFFRVFFNPYHYGVLTIVNSPHRKSASQWLELLSNHYETLAVETTYII